jgi:hypothetical protein
MAPDDAIEGHLVIATCVRLSTTTAAASDTRVTNTHSGCIAIIDSACCIDDALEYHGLADSFSQTSSIEQLSNFIIHNDLLDCAGRLDLAHTVVLLTYTGRAVVHLFGVGGVAGTTTTFLGIMSRTRGQSLSEVAAQRVAERMAGIRAVVIDEMSFIGVHATAFAPSAYNNSSVCHHMRTCAQGRCT